MALPQQGVAYTFKTVLMDCANPGRLLINPPIIAGDFKVIIDGAAPVNLSTLPAVSPAGTASVLVSLTAAEMGLGGPSIGSKIEVLWRDPEFIWSDGHVFIEAPVSYLTSSDLLMLSNAAGAWSQQPTEAYAADGVTPTRDQFLFMLWSALSQFIVTGTTINCKRLDGATNSMIFTMNDAYNPTQRIRTT